MTGFDPSLTHRLREGVHASIEEAPHGPIRDAIVSNINLMENIVRGGVAETLVALAIGGSVTASWEPWDVVAMDGTTIEVKATGLVQAWPQVRPSSPSWDIAPKRAYLSGPNGESVFDGEVKRRADVYVFGLHMGVRPAEPGEWEFRVVSRRRIDEVLGDQKRITLGSLDAKLDPILCDARGLEDGVCTVVGSV